MRILANAVEPLGTRSIAAELEHYGIELAERAVCYYLNVMDERGLTRPWEGKAA